MPSGADRTPFGFSRQALRQTGRAAQAGSAASPTSPVLPARVRLPRRARTSCGSRRTSLGSPFAVPWHNKIVIGTTDVEKENAELEPRATEEEIEYILETAGDYFADPPKRKDILSVFAGQRPLVIPASKRKITKKISRGHKVIISESGLVSITGGKWTTYRGIGEDVINKIEKAAGWPPIISMTKHLNIHGFVKETAPDQPLGWYGSDDDFIHCIIKESSGMGEYISEKLQINGAQVILAVRNEMARTVEDMLARRTRALQLDANESIRMAPAVAELMAKELGRDRNWQEAQVEQYTTLAKRYLVN